MYLVASVPDHAKEHSPWVEVRQPGSQPQDSSAVQPREEAGEQEVWQEGRQEEHLWSRRSGRRGWAPRPPITERSRRSRVSTRPPRDRLTRRGNHLEDTYW